MKKKWIIMAAAMALLLTMASGAFSFFLWDDQPTLLTPRNGGLEIPLKDISDGKAHFFKVKADDGIMVHFFTLKSNDGVIRAAIDACDVCYRSGKGYKQDGDFMVCRNCGQRFASRKINEIKGGCNPAPLQRTIKGDALTVAMQDINTNSWYAKFMR